MDHYSRWTSHQYLAPTHVTDGEANDPSRRPNSTRNPGHMSQTAGNYNVLLYSWLWSHWTSSKNFSTDVEDISAAKYEVIHCLANRHVVVRRRHVAVHTAQHHNTEGLTSSQLLRMPNRVKHTCCLSAFRTSCLKVSRSQMCTSRPALFDSALEHSTVFVDKGWGLWLATTLTEAVLM
jgi:hypothetical protein